MGRVQQRKQKEQMARMVSPGASTYLGATQVSVRLVPVQDFIGSSTRPIVWLRRFYASVYDNKFPSPVASLFSWRYLAAITSSFIAPINLRPPLVAVPTQTSASNAVAFQFLRYVKRRDVALYAIGPSFSFPPRPLRSEPSRFPNTTRFGGRPPVIRMSVPAHKSLVVRNALWMLVHPVISRARLYEVIRSSGILRLAPMIRNKTRW